MRFYVSFVFFSVSKCFLVNVSPSPPLPFFPTLFYYSDLCVAFYSLSSTYVFSFLLLSLLRTARFLPAFFLNRRFTVICFLSTNFTLSLIVLVFSIVYCQSRFTLLARSDNATRLLNLSSSPSGGGVVRIEPTLASYYIIEITVR